MGYYNIISHINNRKDIMQYYVMTKIADDYFTVDKVRKPIATFNEAVAKIKALKTLDDEATTYIITQQVGFDDKK
mgnify:CR=1 FL=1|tara:strand:+ start:68 stop:292 length:225 start_codon:yes stop_codon:yes gene_type:complete